MICIILFFGVIHLSLCLEPGCAAPLGGGTTPCLSWDPPPKGDLGRAALLGRGATIPMKDSLESHVISCKIHGTD